MIALTECAAILLCAGQSRRFGAGNKLLAPLAGKPLSAHAAGLCAGLPFATMIAVVPPDELELASMLVGLGFDLVTNDRPEREKDRSIRLGLARAAGSRVRGMVVLLGDMPHVTPEHVQALSAAAADDRAAISLADGTRSPPILLPAAVGRTALSRPAVPVRESLGNAVLVAAAASILKDYDVPRDFKS